MRTQRGATELPGMSHLSQQGNFIVNQARVGKFYVGLFDAGPTTRLTRLSGFLDLVAPNVIEL